MTILRRPGTLSIAGLLVIVASGCTSTASSTPSPTAAPTATSEATDAAATATADISVVEAWAATAAQHRGQNGEQFDFDCPAGGEARFTWGTDIYTDDSSVCTAAVHAGVITLAEGGTVTIEIRPGEDEYTESERNGIESASYPAWGGSFVVIDD